MFGPTGWLEWRPGAYARSSSHLFGWLLLRALCQAAMVVVLSRTLGAEGYGRFVAVLAVASFLTPFAGMGLSGVLLREGARRPDFIRAYLRSALRVWVPSTALCIVISIGVAVMLLPSALPWLAVVVLVVGEVVAASITDLFARAAQASHRIGRYGAINAGLSVLRLIALLIYIVLARPTAGGWMWVYAISSLAYIGLLWVWMRKLKSNAIQSGVRLRTREGLPFALASLSIRLQSEFNKPVLAHLGFQFAGNFSAAQRATDIASLPLMALQEALWPRLYASGCDAGQRLRKTGALLMLLALAGGVALWIAAPFLPHLLGVGFTAVSDVLRWLAWVPAVQLLRNLASAQLVHSGQTRAIGIAHLVGTATSIAAVGVFVPRFGIEGAVMSIYVTEAVLIIFQFRLFNRPREPQDMETDNEIYLGK